MYYRILLLLFVCGIVAGEVGTKWGEKEHQEFLAQERVLLKNLKCNYLGPAKYGSETLSVYSCQDGPHITDKEIHE